MSSGSDSKKELADSNNELNKRQKVQAADSNKELADEERAEDSNTELPAKSSDDNANDERAEDTNKESLTKSSDDKADDERAEPDGSEVWPSLDGRSKESLVKEVMMLRMHLGECAHCGEQLRFPSVRADMVMSDLRCHLELP